MKSELIKEKMKIRHNPNSQKTVSDCIHAHVHLYMYMYVLMKENNCNKVFLLCALLSPVH